MKRMRLWGVASLALASALGCATAKKTADTTVKGAETAGTGAWESAKTAGGTTRGLVTGGTEGAKNEYETGAANVKQKTGEKAQETRDAARGYQAPPPDEK